MRSITRLPGFALLAILLSLVICGGCTSVGGYYADRGRDATDILDLSFGSGIGAGIRAGPMSVALIKYAEHAGFRGPHFYIRTDYDINDWLGAWCVPDVPRSYIAGRVSVAGDDIFVERGKGFTAEGRGNPIILIPTLYDERHYPAYFYTQIDLAVAIGGGVRLGVNPGELVDFLFGWFGVDIFSDDLKGKRPDL